MNDQTRTNQRPHVVRDAKGKRPQFYATPGLDEAMSMILVLASELCVVRDRMDAIERVSRARGIDLAAEVEALVLDESALAERETRRQDFMSRLYYVMRKQAGEAAAAETDASYRATIEEIAAG